MGTGVFFLRGVKWPEHEDDLLLSSSDEVKNEWSYTSTAFCLHDVNSWLVLRWQSLLLQPV
jgi:hypothetical protein